MEVLVVSHDVVGAQMAGPGIRYWNLARVLSREFAVTLATPHSIFDPSEVTLASYTPRDWNSLAQLARAARVIILPGILASDFPQLAQCDAAIVIDGYDPYLAEWLAATETRPRERETFWASFAETLAPQSLLGDFFICASERQRDWWLGQLDAFGRVNAWTFADDESLRRLVDVVSYGLPDALPQHTRNIVKGVWAGIAETDRVILWGGGLWQWLDPFTAIRAVAKIWQERRDVRLIFPGTRHPNPAMAAMPTLADAARVLADQLGLLNRAIFFGDWIAHADWHNVLLESDLALTLHARETLETRLAFRSRVLDYIWASVPIIASRGDATSELIAQNHLGTTVACGDVEGVARAILGLLETPRARFAERFADLRATLTWENVARPLIEFCRAPRHAPDKRALGEQLGNPFYLAERARAQTEIARVQSEIAQNKNRRAVRIADWLEDFYARVR